jgi:hypothetical protein
MKRQSKKTSKRTPSVGLLPDSFRWKLYRKVLDDLEDVMPLGKWKSYQVSVRNREDPYIALGASQGLQSIPESSETGVQQNAATQLGLRFMSKYSSTADSARLHEEAVAKYVATDRQLGDHRISRRDIHRLREYISKIVGRCPSFEEIGSHARHGPGSSRTASYSKKDAYFKYRSLPYEASPRLFPELSNYILDSY